MVGSGTIAADDPRLNVRGVESLFDGGDYQAPLKVVVGSAKTLSPASRLLEDGQTLLATACLDHDIDARVGQGVSTLHLPSKNGRVDLERLLEQLGSRSPAPIPSLFLEGGPTLAASMIQEGLVDELRLHIAPKLMGGDGLSALHSLGVLEPAQCPHLQIVEVNTFEPDIEIIATFG